MVTTASPILAVSDVPEAVRYYTDVLGFPSSWMGGDPPDFGAAEWGSVRIMFMHVPEPDGRFEAQQIWLDAEDVDALHALHLERGATIVSAIEDKPWMRREYTVRDPNGYHLRFAGNPSHTSRGSDALPPDVRIVRRMPTVEEFDRVTSGAFHPDESRSRALEQSWRAVVAVDPKGGAIGTLRIMRDAVDWFSIWDVAVLPSWQGRRIGTAMMEASMEIIREESPGANVYLFTYKHEFYERLGFSKGTVDTLRL